MIEYIFHGKRIDCDEWAEGYLGYNKTRKQYYIMDDVDSFPIPVHKESVGKWTGMNDKNGRKIFEGDIVDCWSDGVRAKGTVQQRKDGLWIIYPAKLNGITKDEVMEFIRKKCGVESDES